MKKLIKSFIILLALVPVLACSTGNDDNSDSSVTPVVVPEEKETEKKEEEETEEEETEEEEEIKEDTKDYTVPTDDSVDLSQYIKVGSDKSNPYVINYVYMDEDCVLKFLTYDNHEFYLKPIEKVFATDELEFSRSIGGGKIEKIDFLYKCEVYIDKDFSSGYALSWRCYAHYVPTDEYEGFKNEIKYGKIIANSGTLKTDNYFETGKFELN